MEKLELKHVVGYLPYDLKVYACYNEYILELEEDPSQGDTISVREMIDNGHKPILRPLSDLTKEIEGSIVYDQLSFRSRLDFQYTCPSILKWSYDDIQILLKYHFDIHGLIEKGLAIDLNTIENGIQ